MSRLHKQTIKYGVSVNSILVIVNILNILLTVNNILVIINIICVCLCVIVNNILVINNLQAFKKQRNVIEFVVSTSQSSSYP